VIFESVETIMTKRKIYRTIYTSFVRHVTGRNTLVERSKNVLSVLHSLRVRFVRYKSVTSTVKSVNCTSFIRYMCVDRSVIVRFVRFMRPVQRS
jgi:hypothetical protein